MYRPKVQSVNTGAYLCQQIQSSAMVLRGNISPVGEPMQVLGPSGVVEIDSNKKQKKEITLVYT
jgi:hypothetical protein